MITLSHSELIDLDKKYETEIKNIKDNLYRIGWHMRGSLSYHDLFHTITHDDIEIINRIIKEQIETVNKTGLALI